MLDHQCCRRNSAEWCHTATRSCTLAHMRWAKAQLVGLSGQVSSRAPGPCPTFVLLFLAAPLLLGHGQRAGGQLAAEALMQLHQAHAAQHAAALQATARVGELSYRGAL